MGANAEIQQPSAKPSSPLAGLNPMESPNTFEQFASASAVEAYLTETAIKQYSTLFGQPGFGYYYPLYVNDVHLSAAAVPVGRSFPDAANTTNVQVAGVDEADLIETDGEFLYQVNGQTLTILDARDSAELEIATQFSITPPWEISAAPTPIGRSTGIALPVEPFFPVGGPVGGWNQIDGMYLQGDRLTVISTGWSPGFPFATETPQTDDLAFSSWILPGQPHVQVTVLDVADPNQVSLVETSLLEGNLISSRAIGDEVVVVTSQGVQLPAPLVIEDVQAEGQSSEAGGTENAGLVAPSSLSIAPYPPYSPQPQGSYETQEAYLARIEDQILDLGLANVETKDGQGQTVESGLLTAPTNIYKPLDDQPWQQLTTVSTFDVGDQHLGVDESVALPTSSTQQVFASKDYLYLLRSVYNNDGTSSTQISQLDLETSELLAVGEVPGRIDNQFSVDEKDGFLRISTTTGWGDNSLNNIYVLDQVDRQLDIVGKVEGLAPGERIYSTRFQGDYGFVVTFRQIDPLFALDLSDPYNPKVVGELKIPGFSEYLQVIEQGDQRLLIGIGRDADPDTGWAQALKVSLFDVTDLANPVEIDNYIFEGDYSSSDALWNHKAVTYVPEQRLLAIPSQEYDRNSWTSQQQLTVFELDGKQGIQHLGEVDHGSDWINRSVSIDGDLFAVSGQKISAYDVSELELLDQVKWHVDSNNRPFHIRPGAEAASIVWNTETGVVSSLSLEAEASTEPLTPLGRTITDIDWALQTVGDMDGDGQKDVLLRHAKAGKTLLWLMDADGKGIKSEAVIGRDLPDVNWSIAGTGDMDGDGHTDIVLHNSVADQIVTWYMDGAGNILSESLVGRQLGDDDWQIAAVADFNGDGKADMLLRHGVVGQNVLLEMDGAKILAESLFGRRVADSDWQIEGAQDFDGNGTVDVFWRHQGVGTGLVWSMADKNTIASEVVMANLPDGMTQIVA